MPQRRQFLQGLTATAALSTPAWSDPSGDATTRILLVVGPTDHPPGTHEVAAGGRLMKHCLENAAGCPGLKVDLFHEWPKDQSVLDAASSVVFIGDTFPLQRLPETASSLRQLGAMMKRGCGIVCVHYATGLLAEDVPPDGAHPLLAWMGGYFATKCAHHQSVARVFPKATITPAAPAHPTWRGCDAFTLHDEPYINNYFGPDANKQAPHVTSLATSMLPPEAPRKECVAWCVEREDRGRGFGVVMPHFFRNWENGNLRTFILNGIAWSAGCEVPPEGMTVALPALASFRPAAVTPPPRKQKPVPQTPPDA